MDFIVYVTTAGGRIDIQAEHGDDAVKRAIEQEEKAGRRGAQVIDVSYRHPDDGNFRAMGDEALATIPGTALYGTAAVDGEGISVIMADSDSGRAAHHISDPDIRALFVDDAGELRDNMRFLYSTSPAATTYFVFQWRRGPDDWVDEKMTKTGLIAKFGS